LSNRWVAVPWILYGLGVWWLGCWQKIIEWRGPGVVLVLFSSFRCVLGDLPTDRTTPFIPLFDQASLPTVLTALLLGSARPFFKRYAGILTNEERRLGLFAGLAAIALLFIILSLDTFQYCRVVLDPEGTRDLLPHAVLSVVWSMYAGLLLTVGFWRKIPALRWAALGLFGLTLGKVLLIDLGWLSGLYRILALLLIALVLAGATWAYQRREIIRKAIGVNSSNS
jgi:uncharacterized membrane protein